MNRLVLAATLVERAALRYTPAGLPALDLSLKHESTVSEAGMSRKVVVELRARGIGPVTGQLETLAVSSTASFKGFLGAARNGKGVVLHITEVQGIEVQPSRS